MQNKRAPQKDEAALRREPSTLFTRLLDKLAGQRTPDKPPGDELPAPGQRSGRGASTIAPYLEHGRSTRPGDLE